MPQTSNQPIKLGSSRQRTPRIALIGCGAVAEGYWLPALAKWPHVMETLILVDQDQDRVRKLGQTFKVRKCLTDYRDVLDDTDGAIIALPTHLHYPIATELLSRGLSVLCEKPLAESADKARAMVELASKMGVGLATNYSQRLWPQFAKVKELIANGSLGEPVHIKYFVGDPFNWPTVSGFYFNSTGSGRGILRDRGAHVFDHICWWLGGKPEVTLSQNDAVGGSEAVAYVQFEHNKCVGEVKLSWLSKFPSKFLVEFERGSIEGEVNFPQSVMVQLDKTAKTRVNLKAESYMALGDKIVANFIGVITGTEKPLVPASEVLDSIRFIDECYAAVRRFDMPWYEFSEVESGR